MEGGPSYTSHAPQFNAMTRLPGTRRPAPPFLPNVGVTIPCPASTPYSLGERFRILSMRTATLPVCGCRCVDAESRGDGHASELR